MARTLDNDTRQAVALFRYGVIADLVNLPPGGTAVVAQAARRAASFGVWGVFSETRALWSANPGRISSGSASEGTVVGRRAEWRWRCKRAVPISRPLVWSV